MGYDTINWGSNFTKQVLREGNARLLAEFKLDGAKTTLTLDKPSALPWGVRSSSQIEYTKERTVVRTDAQGQVVSALDVIKKNGDVDSVVWMAPAKDIKTGVRWGIVPTYSVTGQVVGALGKYRLVAHQRIREGVISHRHAVKLALLDVYQDRMEALQVFESMVNKANTRADYEVAVATYTQRLNKIKSDVGDLYHPIKELNSFTRPGEVAALTTQLGNSIECDINDAGKFLASIPLTEGADLSDVNKATGRQSVLTFVKKTMKDNLREMQMFNQIITYKGGSVDRGDLNSAIEDAVRVIEDYQADPHNPITDEHHGMYGKDEDIVHFDSAQNGLSHEQIQDVLLAIGFISGRDQVPESTLAGSYTLMRWDEQLSSDSESVLSPLAVTRSAKWGSAGAWWLPIARAGAWVVNILAFPFVDLIIPVVLVIFEPIVRGIIYPFQKAEKSFEPWQTTKAWNKKDHRLSVENKKAAKLFLQDAVKEPPVTFFGVVAHRFNMIFQKAVVDPIYAVFDMVFAVSVDIYKPLVNDWEDGKATKNKKMEESFKIDFIEASVMKDINDIKSRETGAMTALGHGGKGEAFAERSGDLLKSKRFAAPAFLPTTGEWNDITSATAHGTQEFMGVFMHHIFAKHPFAGMLFSAGYALGGFAVLTPQMILLVASKFGISAAAASKYIAFSKTLGEAMASGKVSSAIAGGFTQGKVLAAAYELVLHGPKSWLVKGAQDFEKDPTTTLVVTAVAISFGHVVAHYAHIPFISEHLREDEGSVPFIADAFAGAKLGLVLYEVMRNTHSHQPINEFSQAQLKDFETPVRAWVTEQVERDDKISAGLKASEIETRCARVMQALGNPTVLKSLYAVANDMSAKAQAAYGQLSTEDQAEKTSIDNKMKLVQLIAEHRGQLHRMSEKTKHELDRAIQHHFKDDPMAARALHKEIYPEKSRSILRTTVKIVVDYIPLVFRWLFSLLVIPLVHQTFKPFVNVNKELGLKVLKDVTRVGRALGALLKTVVSFVVRVLKAAADIVMNSILARGETILVSTTELTKINYAVSGSFDTGYESARQFVGTGLDAAIKQSTSPLAIPTEQKVASGAAATYTKLLNSAAFAPALGQDARQPEEDLSLRSSPDSAGTSGRSMSSRPSDRPSTQLGYDDQPKEPYPSQTPGSSGPSSGG